MNSKKGQSVLLLFMLVKVLVACSTPAELEGTWIGYATASPLQDWTLTIKRNQFRLVCEDTHAWYTGSLVLNNNCSHKKMDLRIKATAVQAHNGKTSLGIYDIEDGSLILVTAEPGNSQRPYSFDDAENVIAFVFEKSKAD